MPTSPRPPSGRREQRASRRRRTLGSSTPGAGGRLCYQLWPHAADVDRSTTSASSSSPARAASERRPSARPRRSRSPRRASASSSACATRRSASRRCSARELIGDRRDRRVAPNVWAVNMDPELALEEYGMMALKSKTLYKLLFDNKYVRTFFRAVPGMQEWTLLGKAWWHTTETREDGVAASTTSSSSTRRRRATGSTCCACRRSSSTSCRRASSVATPSARGRCSRIPKTCARRPRDAPRGDADDRDDRARARARDELELPIGKIVVNGVAAAALLAGGARGARGVRSDRPATDAGDAALVAGAAAARRASACRPRASQRLAEELPDLAVVPPAALRGRRAARRRSASSRSAFDQGLYFESSLRHILSFCAVQMSLRSFTSSFVAVPSVMRCLTIWRTPSLLPSAIIAFS